MISRRSFIAASAAGTAVMAAPAVLRAQTLTTLRVAAIPIDVGANPLYAAEMGFFKKHGIDAQIIPGSSGEAVAAALVGGSLDIGDGNTTVLAKGKEKGLPFALLAPSGMYRASNPTSAMVIAKTNTTIKTPKDLVGKVVGVNAVKAIAGVAVQAWLNKNGLSPNAVRFLEIPFSEMDPALAAGRIDAGMMEEPVLSGALAANSRVFARPYDAVATQFIEGGLFCTLDFAKAHPDVVKRFADAMAETNAWANAHHEQTYDILAKYAKAPPPKNMTRIFYPDRLRAADLQPLIDVSAKYGLLEKTFAARELFAPGLA